MNGNIQATYKFTMLAGDASEVGILLADLSQFYLDPGIARSEQGE